MTVTVTVRALRLGCRAKLRCSYCGTIAGATSVKRQLLPPGPRRRNEYLAALHQRDQGLCLRICFLGFGVSWLGFSSAPEALSDMLQILFATIMCSLELESRGKYSEREEMHLHAMLPRKNCPLLSLITIRCCRLSPLGSAFEAYPGKYLGVHGKVPFAAFRRR